MQSFLVNEAEKWVPPLPAKYHAGYHLGQYSDQEILRAMWKYLVRRANCQRAWARIHLHLPETLQSDQPLEILELSTAHGAMLEIWRDYGHQVKGTDYAWAVDGSTKKHKGVRQKLHQLLLQELRAQTHDLPTKDMIAGWPYQSIIESLGLHVDLFDGGQLPYQYADKSFDVVCCYQAIEAYAHPDRWLDILDEICRITRKTIVLGFNPQPIEHENDEDYLAAAKKAWLAMQTYRRHGFHTVFFEIGQSRRGVHPTAVKLIAD